MSGDDTGAVLDSSAIRSFYDKVGMKLDFLDFFEKSAVNDLVSYGDFESAQNVFEFGCGTGKFAIRLLEQHMNDQAKYLGFEISPVMVGISKKRLGPYSKRAQVMLCENTAKLPLSDEITDRIISIYVLELLSREAIEQFFNEAHRVLTANGKVCVVSLRQGEGVFSSFISKLWLFVFNKNPILVGGCRPMDLDSFVDRNLWRVEHREVMSPLGVSSEVWVIEKRDKQDKHD